MLHRKDIRMLTYYILFAALVAAGIILCRSTKGEFAYLLSAGLAFFIISAIRRFVGVDYNAYATIYFDLNFFSIEELTTNRLEKGFIIPLKIFSELFTDVQAIFIAVAFVIAAGVVIYIYKYSSIKWVSCAAFLVFGLYFNSMNFLRQILAAVVVAYAIRYIYSKQLLRFVVLVLFASCFHLSALIALPFFFILQIKLNYITLSLYCAVTALIYINSNALMELVTRYFYSSYDPKTSVEMSNGLTWTYTAFFAVVFVLAFVFRKRLEKRNPFNSVLISCMFFTVFFELIGTKHAIISRLAAFFMIAPLLLLTPEIIQVISGCIAERCKDDKKKRRLLCSVAYGAIAVYSVAIFQNFLNNNYNSVLPYKTVFSKVEEGTVEYKYEEVVVPGEFEDDEFNPEDFELDESEEELTLDDFKGAIVVDTN